MGFLVLNQADGNEELLLRGKGTLMKHFEKD